MGNGCVGGVQGVVSRGQKKGVMQDILSDGFYFLCEAVPTLLNESKERGSDECRRSGRTAGGVERMLTIDIQNCRACLVD